MSLPARGQCGLCDRFWRNAPADGKEAALAAAKKRVEDGVLYAPIKRKKKGKREASIVNRESQIVIDGKDLQPQLEAYATELLSKMPEKPNPVPVTYKISGVQPWEGIYLEFKDERDKALLLWFEEYSRGQRRSTGDQVKMVLDRYMDIVKSEMQAPGGAI